MSAKTEKEASGSVIRRLLRRYFIDAMSAMALGLFASLIIGLIIASSQKFRFFPFFSS